MRRRLVPVKGRPPFDGKPYGDGNHYPISAPASSMRIAVALVLLGAFFAGCADEGPAESMDGDHSHGLFIECAGSRLDPATYPEHHWPEWDGMQHCAPDEGLSVVLMVNVTKMRAYTSIPVTWYVEPMGGIDHTLRTSLRLAEVGATPPAAGDDFGEEILAKQHAQLPDRFEHIWVPTVGGEFTFWAYAEGDAGAGHWSQGATVEVVGVSATGIVHDFTLSAGGPAAELTPGTLKITAGDSFRFINEDAVAHSFSVESGPVEFAMFAPAQQPSNEFPLFDAGAYNLKDDSFEIRGTVDVQPPEVVPHSNSGASHEDH
jgi:plastocyanin